MTAPRTNGFRRTRGIARRRSGPISRAADDAALDAHARLFVVSPHLDDAVFSCGALLAARPGAVVCTVLAGTPSPAQQRPWDLAAGFEDSTAALRERVREDRRALATCGARGVRLAFLDGQYGPLPDARTLARALAARWSRCTGAVLLAPLGLHHADHRRVAEAWSRFARDRRIRSCLVYEEAIHRSVTGATAARLLELERAGWRVTPLGESWCAARGGELAYSTKRRAVAAYASQLKAFGDARLADLDAPERYWHLAWPGARRSKPARRITPRRRFPHSTRRVENPRPPRA